MKKIFILLLALACISTMEANARKKANRVVVIGIDGWAAEAVRRANPADIPNIHFLMDNGSWTLAKRSVMPSASAINWCSMMCGLPTEMHGFDKWNSRQGSVPSAVAKGNGLPPTIFTILRQQRPTAVSGAIYDWDGIGYVTDTTAMTWHSYTRAQINHKQVIPYDEYTGMATDYIVKNKPQLFLLYFAGLDGVGHDIGWYTPEYFAKMKELDVCVGLVIKALKDAGMYDDTVIIMTADHGGKDKGHGGFTILELESPFIISGPGIRKGHEFTEPMMQYDAAATIAAILKLRIPDYWVGRPKGLK